MYNLDFYEIIVEVTPKGGTNVKPEFLINNSTRHLLIAGQDFKAVYDPRTGFWSTNEDTVRDILDSDSWEYKNQHQGEYQSNLNVKLMRRASSKIVDEWHKFVKQQMRDNYTRERTLNTHFIYASTQVQIEDYATEDSRLKFDLVDGETPAWNEMLHTWYDSVNSHKIEWQFGSLFADGSLTLQKCFVFVGPPGCGKSSIINIETDAIAPYVGYISAKDLGAGKDFAVADLKNNPRLAVQHDAKLSRIEDNTILNQIISHETIMVNEKFKQAYPMRFNTQLVFATNEPVQITDARSGLIRRLIDISPTGRTMPKERYDQLMEQVKFEYGAIAKHCMDVYLANPRYYDDYVAVSMVRATNEFYNFVIDKAYDQWKKDDCTTLTKAYDLYLQYASEAGVPDKARMRRSKIRMELMDYFRNYEERQPDGMRVRNFYSGFLWDKFLPKAEEETKPIGVWLDLRPWSEFPKLIFETEFANCSAQYNIKSGSYDGPEGKWEKCTKHLYEIDTSRLHWVKTPLQLICIDFDLKGPDGEKSYERNLEAASKWPATYAETSKSGKGIHLYYYYDGDVAQLSGVFAEDIEVKVYSGNSALRRMLVLCNDISINHISSNLPLKEVKKTMIDFDRVETQESLRAAVETAIKKQTKFKNGQVNSTTNEIHWIRDLLQRAYSSGIIYDLEDMRPDVTLFALHSKHQASHCINVVTEMKFKSVETAESGGVYDISKGDSIVFFDCEVYQNFFCICYQFADSDAVGRMMEPSPEEVQDLLKYRLVGFNCRKYDNHILYARAYRGYSDAELYELSQSMINDRHGFIPEAYNASYTDIWDFNDNKQSLKKWEIELGIHHQEMDIPWDEPVPEDRKLNVVDYCCNDVRATKAVFEHCHGAFDARKMLAAIAKLRCGYGCENDPTNTLTTRIVFGRDKHPQGCFNYRKFNTIVSAIDAGMHQRLAEANLMTSLDNFDRGDGIISVLPYFPSYKFELLPVVDKEGHTTYVPYSTYKPEKATEVEEVGEGGEVWAKHGMYGRTYTMDVAGMHPASVRNEDAFGHYTSYFSDIVKARLAIKHKDYDYAKKMLGGALAPFLENPDDAKLVAKALKIAVNSVYGLTAAHFDNPFRNPDNDDNYIAKRGALFMVDLLYEVLDKGFTVIHIKTDSIKVVDPTPELLKFIVDFGKKYGYDFEIEHIFERICLVNNAVYIAKVAEDDPEWMESRDRAIRDGKPIPTRWTATGAQFAHPYVFKTLFTHEPIIFADLCETKSVKTSMYLDLNESLPEGDHEYKFVGKAGSFCPMLPGSNSGWLVSKRADKDGNVKYDSVVGTKDYRWMESETVEMLNMQDQIDISYHNRLAEEAIKSIQDYGPFEDFVNGTVEDFMEKIAHPSEDDSIEEEIDFEDPGVDSQIDELRQQGIYI